MRADIRDLSLSKRERILRRDDFLRIGKLGKKIKTNHFIILFLENDLAFSRVGITVTRKIGKAVERNRVKRLIREFFRLNREAIPKSNDFIFIAGKGSPQLVYSDIVRELLGPLKKAA